MTEMLQKNENVAKNVANENSQDLTEQWKKGELPEGHYYIKTRSEINIDEYIQWYKDHGIPSEKSFAYFNVQQVLAEVPSYEEWQDLKSKLQLKETAYDFDTARLEEENAQLKEQINKCYLDVINRGTANAVKAVKEFGMPERIKELVEQNVQLKELLKEWVQFEIEENPNDFTVMSERMSELANKTKEVLK